MCVNFPENWRWIATVYSRTTTTSFECSRTSCLRSASTRTCDQCTNRFTLASCCCTYRIQDMRASVPSLNSSAPAYISDMLQTVSSLQRQTNLRSVTNSEYTSTRHKQLLFVPCTRLRVGERAFSSAAPRLWNALPTDIKRAATLLTFKKKLKTFLFSKHLCWFYCILSSPCYYTLHIYL